MLPTPSGVMPTWPNFVCTTPLIVMSLPITSSAASPGARRMPATNSALEVVACGSRVAFWIQIPASAL